MLTSLKIENYRCFKSFELEPLGRINLLVGKNNSGKTSILEVIEILLTWYGFDILKSTLERRGELSEAEYRSGNMKSSDVSEYSKEFEFQSLLSGKSAISEEHFSVAGDVFGIEKETQVDISRNPEKIREMDFFRNGLTSHLDNFLFVKISSRFNTKGKTKIVDKDLNKVNPCALGFLNNTSIDLSIAKDLHGEIMFNPEENYLLDALRILEPRIDGIAPNTSNETTTFYVKLKGEEYRVPLNTMGDGMWRMLSIALMLVTTKEGVLLIDEIDTGLHYTAMVDMWRFIWKVAKKLDVQVFATTHNSDCWRSLAAIANEENPSEDGITIHRIEKGASRSIVFTEPDIVVAAENEIEVR